MSESKNTPKTMTTEQFALYTARPQTRIAFVCVILLATGIYLGFRDGWATRALIFGLSSVAALGGMWILGGQLMHHARTGRAERSVSNAIGALTGFAPYLFGVYLFFYEGLWGLVAPVSSGFSITHVLGRLIFIYLGYKLVKWTYQMSEIGDQLSSGNLVIVDGDSDQAA